MQLRLLILLLASITIFQSCIDPVDAEYDFRNNILFVDAYALTESGISTVTISQSLFEFQTYKIVNVSNAKVMLENINSGSMVEFLEDNTGVYRCPMDFATTEGETWKLHIELEDGRKIESKSQTVTPAIPIDDIHVEYSPEIEFNITFGKFIPGHRISIDWKDPPNKENFYLWKYRTYESLYVCKTCTRGIYRNGACQPSGSSFGPPYYNYLCDPICWLIRYGNELPIFEDRLADGNEIKDREITIIPYLRRSDISIEIQQMSVDKTAYEYFKVINDQVNENGGLNAPPPAALLGNLFNPDDATDLVLGQFTTAGVSTKSVYIDRSVIINEQPLTPDDPIIIETCPSCPTLFPCEEGPFRTSIKPVGWP